MHFMQKGFEERSDEKSKEIRIADEGFRKSMEENWNVYIIECKTEDLYVGIAQNVTERIVRHNKGLACRYTKFRRPVQLVYSEFCGSYNTARKRESEIKRFSRAKKLKLAEIFETSRPA